MLLQSGAIVAIVDGHSLSLFRNVGQASDVHLEAIAGPTLKSEGAGSGIRHHSSSANPDQSRLDEDGFAAAAADYLNTEVLEGRINALFVIATPKTLGELRLRYHSKLQGVLIGEEAKDMVGRSGAEIEALIAKSS